MATISGSAKLENGLAATLVFVRDWITGDAVGNVIPETDGHWSLTVPEGSYEVVTRGPVGYQPIAHGPIVVED